MKQLFWALLALFASHACAQSIPGFPIPPINASDPALPRWVQLMYAPQPNIHAVTAALDSQFRVQPFGQNVYTRYFKHWRRYVRPFTDAQGNVQYPTSASQQQAYALQQAAKQRFVAKENAAWTFAGPNVHYVAKNDAAEADTRISDHGNIYCIDRSLSHPNVLFCGAEDGGVYKSTDAGQHWSFVSQGLPVRSVSSVAVHATDPQIALFCAAGEIWRTTDGGTTWHTTVYSASQYIEAHELAFSPSDPAVAFAATQQGLFRSADTGAHWVQILPNVSRSLAFKPFNANVVYALQYNPTTQIAEVWKSVDAGLTFTAKTNGWFTVPPADAGKLESFGGDIAVTEANPDRVYVLMVGESQASANLQLKGTLGVFRSDDAGETWTHPHGQIGMPYVLATHPNLMDFDGESSTYNQIYYNTTIIASQLNADRILLGGLNTWRSNDGGASYQPVGGYIGNLPYVHPDLQELKVYRTGTSTDEVWCANDGGVNYSSDFYASHESRCFGLAAGQWWGFDQGWNEDILVGGRYHNGNGGFYQTYPDKAFIALGGGEAPTGYANYSPERKVYHSDIGGAILPDSMGGATERFAASLFPNESYWEYNSSRMIFDWNYWNICYLGKDNKLYKSNNAGGTYEEVHAFGTDDDKVLWIEQSRTDPQRIYVQVVLSGESQIWMTPDGGTNWTTIALPLAGYGELLFTLSLSSADELWVAYPYGPNGQKIFHTTDAGTNWSNRTTASLNDLRISCLVHQGGTDGGVYIALKQAVVLYRNNTMSDWMQHGSGLPAGLDPLRMVPFYRDNKLRLASWNMSIWEIPLFEPSAVEADFAINYRTTFCPGDTLFLTAHAVASGSAVYSWNMPGASPSTATGVSPKITYGTSGTYDITLTVSDNGQTSSITKSAFVAPGGSITANFPISEGFETGKFSPLWRQDTEGWQVSDQAGGYGQSSHAMRFNNYDIDLQGGSAEVWSERMDLSTSSFVRLIFDRAYVRYASNYSDTLAVYFSPDCGATRSLLYLKGGSDLATGPDNGVAVFIPNASQWATDTIDLSAYAGAPEAILIFQNRGYWGQAMYVDNVLINKTPWNVGSYPALVSSLRAIPNPSKEEITLLWESPPAGDYVFSLLNATGQTVWSSNMTLPGNSLFRYALPLDLPAGVYMLHASGASGRHSLKLVRE